MKKIILILMVLLAAFIFIWGYKLRQPIDLISQSAPVQSNSTPEAPKDIVSDSSSTAQSAQSQAAPESQSIADTTSLSQKPDSVVSVSGETVRDIVEQEVKDGKYTVKQQVVVTKTYDQNGELVSTKKGEPVEIDRWITE